MDQLLHEKSKVSINVLLKQMTLHFAYLSLIILALSL